MNRFLFMIKTEYSEEHYKSAIKYVAIKKRIENHKAGAAFITQCLNYEKTPSFARLKLDSGELRNDRVWVKSIEMLISERERSHHFNIINGLYKDLEHHQNLLDLGTNATPTAC